MVAEESHLIFPEGSAATTEQTIYRDYYSISKLRDRAEKYFRGDRHGDLWQGLGETFRLFRGSNSASALKLSALNGELFGRISDIPWAVIFPTGGPFPRHPSQLYEAFLEGFLLFVLLGVLAFFTKIRLFAGVLTSIFLFSYGLTRAIVEFFREPDPQLGFLWNISQWAIYFVCQ